MSFAGICYESTSVCSVANELKLRYTYANKKQLYLDKGKILGVSGGKDGVG